MNLSLLVFFALFFVLVFPTTEVLAQDGRDGRGGDQDGDGDGGGVVCEDPNLDSDGDGTVDCSDECPEDRFKTTPGECGCGVPEFPPHCTGVRCYSHSDRDCHLWRYVERDTDCTFNGRNLQCTEDECPEDPNKTEPGICGCGVSDVDSDNDGYADCLVKCYSSSESSCDDFRIVESEEACTEGGRSLTCDDGGDDAGMEGDPHVLTWIGRLFDFMGQCDIVLVHAPNFDGKGRDLSIHVRTTIRYEYSYIESAALQIGEDVLEVSSWGNYAVNGVDTPYLGARHAGKLANTYTIYHTHPEAKKHTFEVVLGPHESINIRTFKDLVAVSIDAGAESAKYFSNSEGIMGSFNGALLARDGVTVMDDMNAFGQEWQVTREEPKLFRIDRAPQYPQECILPSSSALGQRQRRLGETLARRAAEEACAQFLGVHFDACVMDVLAVGDVEIAQVNSY